MSGVIRRDFPAEKNGQFLGKLKGLFLNAHPFENFDQEFYLLKSIEGLFQLFFLR